MVFKIQLKFLWRHPETNTLFEILSIAWKDSAPVIQIEIHSLRPHQPGHWHIPVDTDSQEAAALAQSLKEYRQISHRQINTDILKSHSPSYTLLSQPTHRLHRLEKKKQTLSQSANHQ